MKFNFKKISAIAASALLTGMSMGFAAAAAYPNPFVVAGTANVGIVYGTGSGVSDLDQVQAYNINLDLQSYMGAAGGATATVVGEAFPLFTSSNRIYMNDSISSVKSSLTDTQLPTVLADGDFEGDVSADFTQTIKLGTHATLEFGNHPTSDDDPLVAVSLGTTAANYIYNATVTFNKAVNFTHSDSVGETLDIFGQQYTIGAGTTNTTLYLYKSSETVALSVGGTDPSSATVTVNGDAYTVELVWAGDDEANIRITDSSGNSETKEITEDQSKKVQGIDVAVNAANEDANGVQIAEVTVGADKLKFVHASEVRVGSDEDLIEGTNVVFSTGTGTHAMTSLSVQVFASDTDLDAIVEGGNFVDPVFGSFKIDFSGLNIAEESTARETFEIKNSGKDKATIKFITHTGDGGDTSFNWYYNSTASTTAILGDSGGDVINVIEMAQINKTEYAIVGNEENGYLVELKTISNATDGHADDYIEFKDVFSAKIYKSQSASSEGTTTIMIGTEEYTATYNDNKLTEGDEWVRLDYPDTTGEHAVIYPTIETSKGANLALYEPITIDLDNWDGSNTLERLYFPDGDGYTYVGFTYSFNRTGSPTGDHSWNVTNEAATVLGFVNKSAAQIVDIPIGELIYHVKGDGTINNTVVYLEDVGTTAISLPGIVIFEEQDDSTSTLYSALIVKMEGAGTDADEVGVSDVEMTWGSDAYWDNKQLQTDTDLYKDVDYWGTITTTDTGTTSQTTATISYPDEQVYAQVYVAEEAASITAGVTAGGTAQIGNVVFKDSETSSYADKNVIVVGGSCINSAAAALVGGAYCTADWTDATEVGSGEFLIKGYSSSTVTSKLALLVAGYDAADTVNAATYLWTKKPDTSKAWKGTTATAAATEITAA